MNKTKHITQEGGGMNLNDTHGVMVVPAPVEPMGAWVAYAKRAGLLDENGVAPDRAKAQTAWFAFTAAWNEARTPGVPAAETQQKGGA